MRTLLLALMAFLPFSASGGQILGNTPDTVSQNVIGCYGGSAGSPCYNGAAVANNKSAWIGIGWTMGANAYSLQEADVMLIIAGFSQCSGCVGLFSGSLFSDNGGVPGSLVASLTPSPNETKGATPVQYAFTPPSPVTLQANTSYWLLLRADYPTFALLAGIDALTGSGATYVRTLQSSSTGNSNAPLGANPIAALGSSNGLQPYFVLKADTGGGSPIPEPSTFLLIAGVLLAAGLRHLAVRLVGQRPAAANTRNSL